MKYSENFMAGKSSFFNSLWIATYIHHKGVGVVVQTKVTSCGGFRSGNCTELYRATGLVGFGQNTSSTLGVGGGGSRTTRCPSPHAEDSAVEVQRFLGILDSHHGLLHDEVLTAVVGLRDVGLCVGTWNTLHGSYS